MASPISADAGRIFVSYRREDTAYPAGWLYDRLAEDFGRSQVFKDVDSIELGDDFAAVITNAVGACDVLLVLIGERWSTVTDEAGHRRLDDPDDFVRLEVEAALTRGVRVIPILVGGARMPRTDELPVSIVGLARRQALELSPTRFESDTGRLVKVVERTLQEVRAGQPEHLDQAAGGAVVGDAGAGDGPASSEPLPRHAERRTPPWLVVAAGIVAALVLVGLGALLASIVGDDSDGESADVPDGASGAAATVAPGPEPSPDSQSGLEFRPARPDAAHMIDVSDLSGGARNDPPRVDDLVTVRFTLTNLGDDEVEIDEVFLGVRWDEDPDTSDVEDETIEVDVVLAPGEEREFEGGKSITGAGVWTVFPCYQLSNGDFCPDEWAAAEFTADDQ